jgi:hypothetical protein
LGGEDCESVLAVLGGKGTLGGDERVKRLLRPQLPIDYRRRYIQRFMAKCFDQYELDVCLLCTKTVSLNVRPTIFWEGAWANAG